MTKKRRGSKKWVQGNLVFRGEIVEVREIPTGEWYARIVLGDYVVAIETLIPSATQEGAQTGLVRMLTSFINRKP